MLKNTCTQFLLNLNKNRYDYLFILIGLVFIFWGRWDSILYPLPLNPDEAQAAANALRFISYGLSWNAMDGTTAGPYNTLIISWPYFFGGDVTFSTIRLTACGLLGSIFVLVYSSIRSISGRFYAALFTLPLAVFYGLTENPEFLHYSSEIFPLFLLVLANFLAVKAYNNTELNGPNLFPIILLGLAIGGAPFAKLQSSPMAIIVGVFSIYLLLRSPNPRKIFFVSVFILSCLSPGLALLLPLFLTNNLHHFFTSYLSWANLYVKESLSFIELHKLIANDPLLKSLTYFVATLGISSLFYISFFINRDKNNINLLMTYSIAVLLVAFYAIAKPGNGFPHYLMFFPPFAILFVGYSVCCIPRRKHYMLYYFLFFIAIAFYFTYPTVTDHFRSKSSFGSFSSSYKTKLKNSFIWKSPNIFLWISKPTDRLLVWGWMPQWYVWSGLTPATRETHNYSQIVQTKLIDYYRKRLLYDIDVSSPNIIIDSVTGNSFGFNDANKNGILTFPALGALVSSEFERLGDIRHQNPSCPKIYIKKPRMIELREHIIDLKSISASARYPSETNLYAENNLDDNSVTEDSCIDYWLAPDGQLDDLHITFNAAEPVRKLLILNTKNGRYLDRATKNIKFSLYNKEKLVFTKELLLNHHPRWTEFVFDRPYISDSMRIKILSFEGLGAGLNEIKIIRESP